MKHLSIKSKVIYWFLGVFTLVLLLYQIILWSYSASIVTSRSEQEIKEVVVDVTDYLRIGASGPFYLEDGMEEPFLYFYDDIIFAFYENEQFKYGYLPYTVLENLDVETNQLREIEIEGRQYLIFDVFINDNYVMRAVKNVSTSEAAVRELLIASLLVSPIVILISGAGGYFIMKRAFKPIHDITETAKDIKEQQNYSSRIMIPDAKDEIYQMTLMVNSMLESIESTISREKTFTSNVSHELRTPLTVLKAQVEYLQDKLSNTQFLKDTQEIIKQIQYLEDMVKAILMLTKVNETEVVKKEKVFVLNIIENILDAFHDQMISKKIEIDVQLDANDYVMGDSILITSLLSNLISNAIKYNKDEGIIYISGQSKDGKMNILIKDTGIGMSPSDTKQIFHPFYRSDQVRTIDHLSLGIGMTIVKNIIDRHHGNIQISSVPGEGTQIQICI